MLFRKSKLDKSSTAEDAGASVARTPPAIPTVVPLAAARAGTELEPLKPEALRRTVDPKSLGFKDTSSLEAATGPVGQDRAFEALWAGLESRSRFANIVVVARASPENWSWVRRAIENRAATLPVPDDLVRVRDFSQSGGFVTIRLATGRGAALARLMTEAIDDLKLTLPLAFQSEAHRIGNRAIDGEFRASQDDAIDALKRKALAQNVAILRTPTGFGMAPMHDGRVVKPDVFRQLPDAMRREIEQRIEALETSLRSVLEAAPSAEAQRGSRLKALADDVAGPAVGAALDRAKAEFADVADARDWLADAERDLVRNAGLFLQETQRQATMCRPVEAGGDASVRYAIEILADRRGRKTGAPVIEVRDLAACGLAAALQRARGGFLLVDAAALLGDSAASAAIESALDDDAFEGKLVVLGDGETWTALSRWHRRSARYFQVRAALELTAERTTETDNAYARHVAFLANRDELRPFAAAAVARMIEESVRRAEHQDRVSLDADFIAELAIGADHEAAIAGRKLVASGDVERAISGLFVGASGAIDAARVGPDVTPGQIMTVTLAGRGFVTARAHAGGGHVHDISRECASAALWGYLAGRYGVDKPLALAATITGATAQPGAACADLYALLSALAGVGAKPCIAVIGAFDPTGRVVATPNINDLIEAHYDACHKDSSPGTSGIVIPRANGAQLMLREDVVAAARAGTFRVWPIATIDDGIEPLTGVAAGQAGDDGVYPEGSLHRMIDDTLRLFAERARADVKPASIAGRAKA